MLAKFSTHQLFGNCENPCPALYLDEWSRRPSTRVLRRLLWGDQRMLSHAVKPFLEKHKVGVVLIEYMDQFLDFIPVLEKLEIPYVVQGHGIDVSASLRKPEMREKYLAYKSARAILTRSEFHRQRLIGIGLPRDLIHVNPGGVDVPNSPPLRNERASKRLLAVGRMCAKKSPIHLLESFRLAASQDKEIALDYVGGGPLLPAARQFVDACGLGDRVRLHGVASDETKIRLLRECGVFIQHSMTDPETGDEEGLPASIQEAMAYGLAVIATKHAGIPEAIEADQSGILVDEGDVNGMGNAILEIQENFADFGQAAFDYAKANFQWSGEKARLRHWLS